jgi:hypothetical protein
MVRDCLFLTGRLQSKPRFRTCFAFERAGYLTDLACPREAQS